MVTIEPQDLAAAINRVAQLDFDAQEGKIGEAGSEEARSLLHELLGADVSAVTEAAEVVAGMFNPVFDPPNAIALHGLLVGVFAARTAQARDIRIDG